MTLTLYLFPVAVSISAGIAILFPDFFISFKSWIIPLLSIIMLGMGMTLQFNDFKKLPSQYEALITGLLLQFSIMPVLAYALARLFDLPNMLLAGFVLLGSCPGGTASNVMCYLAKGNVALSILMTSCSTLLAIVLTPLLTWWLIGKEVDVPVFDMILNIVRIVLIPVLFGVIINTVFAKKLAVFKEIFPIVSMAAIVFIIAIIIALNSESLLEISFMIILVVMMHNLIGLILAYSFCLSRGYSVGNCRTIAIEVAMQNSGLAAALTYQYFGAMASLPAALFSIWHNVSIGVIAGHWRNKNE